MRGSMMRLNVYLPTDLVDRVDRVVGPARQRSAFVAAAIREKLKRDGEAEGAAVNPSPPDPGGQAAAEIERLGPNPAILGPVDQAEVDLGDGFTGVALSGGFYALTVKEKERGETHAIRFMGWTDEHVRAGKRALRLWAGI